MIYNDCLGSSHRQVKIVGDVVPIDKIIAAIASFQQEELTRSVERRLFAYFSANAGKWRTDMEVATAVDQSYSSIRQSIEALNLKLVRALGWWIISKHGFGHMIDREFDFNEDPSLLKRGELCLSPDFRRVSLSGEEVLLSYKAYIFLLALMEKSERFWRMGRLVKDFYPRDRCGEVKVRELVREIRAWLEVDPDNPKRLIDASEDEEDGYVLKG